LWGGRGQVWQRLECERERERKKINF
jgi:hypothetical protein